MKRIGLLGVLLTIGTAVQGAEVPLQVGLAEKDITPRLGKKPVYLAGFGNNRKAKGVHDPLLARAVVFRHGKEKIALVSVDLVGLFYPHVESVRKALPGFRHVLVSSTHNHEGPDTLGLWGPTRFQSGVDPAYMKEVEKGIVAAVQAADKACQPVHASIGSVRAPELLRDSRLPLVKHDDLVVLALHNEKKKRVGLVVQWNCHPEDLGSKNTKVSADYVGYTVAYLKKKYRCPVVYLTGTVGGLMTTLGLPIKSARGELLRQGTYDRTERYGVLLGHAVDRALKGTRKVKLTPWTIRTRIVYLPMDNKLYELARQLGVLKRKAFVWTGDPYKATPAVPGKTYKRLCIRSEVGWLRLGQLDIAAIPGEIYPELVLDKVQKPVDPGADYPRAPIEPAIYDQLSGPHRMLIGLANDEVGYIIPKRQWDAKKPFCYGRKKSQYGEINSLGADTAPILCQAFRDLVRGKVKN